jgi:hypothetical protein
MNARSKTMIASRTFRVILSLSLLGLSGIRCARQQSKDTLPTVDGINSLSNIDIDKKYLDEGFISDEIFRVVIISTKNIDTSEIENIKNKAKIRARLSLERILMANNINYDRNTKAGIINLIEKNGLLFKKDMDHKRYDVYYFEITKKNLKSSLKNFSSLQ